MNRSSLLNAFPCTLVLALSSGVSLMAQTLTSGQTTINGRPVTAQQRRMFFLVYRVPMQSGNFWYDSLSGFWGYWGREVAGVLNQGHDFGPLPAYASNGNTGVFINGRELNMTEVQYYQRIFGTIQPGRIWLDGRTGYFGVEGNPQPLGNLASMIQAQKSPQRRVLNERDLNGGFSNSAGTCTKSGNCYYPGQ